MKFSVIVEQVSELLRHRQRVSYRALKREFDLWFTEGFDTKDLQEARALLESLRN